MYSFANLILASFAHPEIIKTTPASLLWILPLSLSVAIIYKITKLDNISPANLVKEITILFGSIVVFMSLIGAGFLVISWAINL
jgi:hypothetical protein